MIKPGISALRMLLKKGMASGELRKSKVMDFPQILIAPGVLAIIWTLVASGAGLTWMPTWTPTWSSCCTGCGRSRCKVCG